MDFGLEDSLDVLRPLPGGVVWGRWENAFVLAGT